MVDTNVWSALGRTRQGQQFYSAVKDAGYVVVSPPSILLELSQSSNVGASRQDAEAVLSGRSTKLPTEAEMISNDLILEIRRLHPEWLRRRPDTARWESLHGFWTKRLWREAKDDWANSASAARALPTKDVELARQNQHLTKAKMREEKLTLAPVTYQLSPDSPKWLLDACPSEDAWVDSWRIELHQLFDNVLAELIHPIKRKNGAVRTYADWFGCFVDSRKLDEVRYTDFPKFCLGEVKAIRVQHFWLTQSAFRYQLEAKVTDSSPVDAQHAAYLPECDLFLTSDRRLVKTLSDMARDAPFTFGRPIRLSGQDDRVIEDVRVALDRGSDAPDGQ